MLNHFRGLILILSGLFAAYTSPAQLQKIYLHPKAAGSEKQSKFIDSIRFTPLEVKEGIELTQFSAPEITKDYFLIRKYVEKEVLLYSKNGRFIKKISYKKLGNEFWPRYDQLRNQLVFFGYNKNYTLTSRDRIKIQLDWNSPRNRKYYQKYTIDLADSNFAIKKETPQQNDIAHAYPFYDDLYSVSEITTSEIYKDSLDYELKLYQGNQLVKGFFPYNRINEVKYLFEQENIGITKTDTPNIHYITRPFCDTIYKMVKDSLWPAYKIVLPLENSVPASFSTKPFKSKTDRENYSRNNGWMLRQIYSVYETPRFLYLTLRYLSNYEGYIYQKQTQTTHKVRNIKPDSSQYNLSLIAGFDFVRKNDRFYKTQKAGDLLSFFEKNKDIPVPPDLESFIKSNPPATTPVIIEFKFKN
ncbi:hypothetical protein [Paraflavitalea sp. CAU 1676]|uniref:hypothetical protein n=1 Tax=Paraflavitalea sp. CAU 1676 TaxID=3032598 RepID=UPI0023DC4027|nr:hypothetical protein [Paraflavitalea sp. CAU 1676]MDF2192688.1 hypothetical protein [Paraflavitalea sp. CAU 1676]